MQERRYNFYTEENQAVRDAYEMLSGNIHLESQNKKIRSVIITSAEPQAGKTSVATSLAMTIACWGRKCVIIDADMRKKPDTKVAKYGSAPGLSHYLGGVAEYEEILCHTNFEGLMYIPNGNISANPMGLICSSRFSKLLDRLNNDFDFLIIDTPAVNTVSDAVVMSPKADGVILVSQIGKTDLKALDSCRKSIETARGNLLGVIINKVSKRQYGRYLRFYKYILNSGHVSFKNQKQNRRTVVA